MPPKLPFCPASMSSPAAVIFNWQVMKGLNHYRELLLGLMLPLLGTTLGAGMVFFIKGPLKESVRKALLGFAAGVMIASSSFSLLDPSVAMATDSGCPAWLPVAVGVPGGAVFFLILDAISSRLRQKSEGAPRPESSMLVLAATLCNIPDGMAMGVVLAGMLFGGAVPPASALTLALGIAIQNFPEGAVISLPLADSGVKKGNAFGFGFLSGAVEPAGAAVTIALTSLITPVLPYILAFAAGAMLYVVASELIPESQAGTHSPAGTIGTTLGFTLMLVLNVLSV